jgi:hypothetical protein
MEALTELGLLAEIAQAAVLGGGLNEMPLPGKVQIAE